MHTSQRGSVNWQDGMLIESSHFTDETEYLRDLNSRSNALALGWFGVHAEPGSASPLDLGVAVAGGRCRVELRRFRGVFPEGLWVDLEARDGDVVAAECPVPANGEQAVAIHLVASDTLFRAVGTPNPEEDPPRQPFRHPLLQVVLGPDSGARRGRAMRVGAVRVRDGVAVLDAAWIPPSLTMTSWPGLHDLAIRFGEYLENWRRTAVDNFIVLLPVATAPAGGTGRQMEFAKRETAYQLAMEMSRLQAEQQVLARTGTPRSWFTLVQTAARSILTLLDLNRELARATVDPQGFASGVAGLRRVADHALDPEDLGSMAGVAAGAFDGAQGLLDSLFTTKPVPDTTLGYNGRFYTQVNYSRRAYRRETEFEFLEIVGLSVPNVADCVVLLQGDIAKLLHASKPTAHIGPAQRESWPTSGPAVLDLAFRDGAVLAHPERFREQRELNQLTLVCRGATNLSAFERGADEDVRVYVLQSGRA